MRSVNDTKEKRARGTTLQIRRERYFARNPLCVGCLAKGKVTAAQELDHIVPVGKGGSDSDPSNWQGLCKACHADKTEQDFGRKPKPVIGLDGWPV